MKKWRILSGLIPVMLLALLTLAGCGKAETPQPTESATPSATAGFTYSSGINENGFWEGVTALDHVELCDYKGIPVPKEIHEVTDGAVQTEIDKILAEFTEKKEVTDRAVADRDTINIDFVGSIDGEEFDNGSTEGKGADVTIGVTNFIDDFLEQLIGHVPGESFDIEVTFPEDYGVENLNGKDAIFAVTINYIIETTSPELTDEFVQKNLSSRHSWTTVDEMKEGIKGKMRDAATASYLNEYIIDNTKVTSIPKSLLRYQEDAMVYYYQTFASQYSMDIEEFLSAYVGVATIDELIQKNNEVLKENASLSLIIQAIAEDADISVNDEDVAAYLKDYAGLEDYSEYKETFGMPYLKLMTLNQSVMDHIMDNSVMQ